MKFQVPRQGSTGQCQLAKREREGEGSEQRPVDRGESFLTHTESFTGVRNIKKTTVRMLLMQDRVLGETVGETAFK